MNVISSHRASSRVRLAALGAAAALVAGCGREPPAPPVPSSARIVSLAPSITELLFALELGDRVVGVTRFCRFPPEAQRIDKVGGYFDPNYEAIVRLRPDRVVHLQEHRQASEYFANLGIATLCVDHRTLDGIVQSVLTVGQACGAAPRAEALAAELRGRMDRVRSLTAGRPRVRTLLCIGKTLSDGRIKDVSLSGREGFYSAMLDCAGATNAYEGPIAFPTVAAEGLLRLAPEAIIDVEADAAQRIVDSAALRAQWNSVGELPAVRNNRVHVLTEDYIVIPGPRFILTLEQIARALHPEVAWPPTP